MCPHNGEPEPTGLMSHVPPSIRAALALLRQARSTALARGHDPWELAVGLPELLAAGLSGLDVRWLLASGLAEHGRGRVRPAPRRRSFRRMANPALTPRSCFIVTDAGLRLLERGTAGAAAGAAAPAVPRWDARRRQLWYREELVKWYRVPAASQETVLAAFEEEGWPPRIDDPLGLVNDLDPRERLHEAVKGLNRGQSRRLLVFRRDGSGEGVLWSAGEGP